MNVSIQPAQDAIDKDYFFRLRNDPVTCRMSRRSEVTAEEHDAWWQKTTDHKFVVLADLRRVGYIRLSQDGTLSIALDTEKRGLGIGTQALRAILPVARALGYRRLFAEIAPENTASQVAFLKANWQPVLFEVTP